MLYGFRMELAGVTQAQYDALHAHIKTLTEPSDRIVSHTSGPTAAGWFVLEVWESKAAADQFMQRVLPQLPQSGPPPSIQEFEVYNCETGDQLRP